MCWAVVVTVCLSVVHCSYENALDAVYVKLNGRELAVVKSAEVKKITYLGTYEFFDGEAINLTCHTKIKPALISITSFAYMDNVMKTKPQDISEVDGAVYLYLKLNTMYNGKYIDCQLTEELNKEMSTVIRVRLILTDKKPEITFQINNLSIPDIKCISKHNFCFVYGYYDKENVTVRCMIDEEMYGNVTCMPKNAPTQYNSDETYWTILEATNVNTTSEYKIGKNTIQLEYFPNDAATKQFPVIKGLSMERTLGMYRRDATTLSILYEYSDELDLECITPNYTFPKWKFNNKKVSKLDTTYITYDIERGERAKFNLMNDYDTASLSCKYSNAATSYIRLIRKYTNTVTAKNVNVSTEIINTVGKSDTKNAITDTGSSEVDPNILIGASIGCLVLIIISVSIIVNVLKRKQKIENLDTNINHDSLPEHNAGKMSVPSQWQDVQYSKPADLLLNSDYAVPYIPILEEKYAKTDIKNKTIALRNDEPTYASIDNRAKVKFGEVQEVNSESPYAEVDNSEQPYAKMHKNENVIHKDSDEVTYAELALKPVSDKPMDSLIESPYAQVMFSENAYKEANSENPYAEVNKRE